MFAVRIGISGECDVKMLLKNLRVTIISVPREPARQVSLPPNGQVPSGRILRSEPQHMTDIINVSTFVKNSELKKN
jgi:hypothetical protein